MPDNKEIDKEAGGYIDPALLTVLGNKEDKILKLQEEIAIRSRKDKWFYLGFILLIVIGLITFFVMDNRKRDQLAQVIVETQKIKSSQDFKTDFINKCLSARQVYQYQGFRKKKYKLGTLRIEKWHAMDLEKYNKLVDRLWEYNQYLGLGRNEQYHILSQLIFESGICEFIEHKTGEIINLTGYTTIGFEHALFVYKYILKITSSSPFYIRALYDRHPNFELIFSDWENVIKFHYAYLQWLLYHYDRRWDFVFTAFNQGETRVDVWNSKGLKFVPNHLLSRKHKLWLRSYYQNILEISYGISAGYNSRISRYSQTLNRFRNYHKHRDAYIKTLKVEFKKREKEKELLRKYDNLQSEVNEYKEINEELTQKMNKLNDINFDININKRTYLRKQKDKIIKEIIDLQKKISEIQEGRFGIVKIIGVYASILLFLIINIYLWFIGLMWIIKKIKSFKINLRFKNGKSK